MGTATLGVQTIMIGAQSLSCDPVYGIIAMAVGAACVAFATAEAQESLGYGNWLKDTVGMSDEVYKGVMSAVNVASSVINIVGVKQCFKEGTLVACLNENGEEVRKPIETVAVGTLVLAYDEATGEKAYKPVVQLFKNETKRWCTVTVEADGQEEQIVSTPGHKYYLPNNTENREIGLQQEHESYITLSEKWVSACKLKAGDKVLLSDGKYGIIVSVKIEELETPETTYNFEVEDFHTYFVGENEVLTHNKCTPNSAKRYLAEEIAKKYDISVDEFHNDIKPEILKRVKPKYNVGKNPDIALNRVGDIAYQGAKGSPFSKGFQDTGLNIVDIINDFHGGV